MSSSLDLCRPSSRSRGVGQGLVVTHLARLGPFTETCTVYFQVLKEGAESQGLKLYRLKEALTPKLTSDIIKKVNAKGP